MRRRNAASARGCSLPMTSRDAMRSWPARPWDWPAQLLQAALETRTQALPMIRPWKRRKTVNNRHMIR